MPYFWNFQYLWTYQIATNSNHSLTQTITKTGCDIFTHFQELDTMIHFNGISRILKTHNCSHLLLIPCHIYVHCLLLPLKTQPIPIVKCKRFNNSMQTQNEYSKYSVQCWKCFSGISQECISALCIWMAGILKNNAQSLKDTFCNQAF